MTQNFGNNEIILIAESVAREKNIPKESVIQALEDAIRTAARRKYGYESSIRAEIDRKSGEIKVFREMQVVDNDYIEQSHSEVQPENQDTFLMSTIFLKDALLKKPDAKVGEILSERLPAFDLGRVSAQLAKHVITSKVKEIERERNYNEYKDKVGKIVGGIVEKIERNSITVKIGSAEAVLRNEFLIRDEKNRIKQGERIRALVYEVNKEGKGPQILLSRTHKEFLSELFTQEVPEIYDRIIEIKAIARDPGLRAKIAVFSSDPSIDAVGSCVGMRGSRVQAVITELNGEKIDVIEWSYDLATTIVNALAPAEVSKVIIDEEKNCIEVVVPDEQLKIAIGRRGQNVRLASELLNWDIDVLTEDDESTRRSEEFSAITNKFIRALDVEEILAQLLASEGFNSIQSVADADVSDIANIEGLDETIATELISRAKDYAANHEDAKVVSSINVDSDTHLDHAIIELPSMTKELAEKLHEAGISTLQLLADLSRDEVFEMVQIKNLKQSTVDSIIMAAREKIYFNG